MSVIIEFLLSMRNFFCGVFCSAGFGFLELKSGSGFSYGRLEIGPVFEWKKSGQGTGTDCIF